jgi:DNA processing protein
MKKIKLDCFSKELYYIGDKKVLDRPKVSIVGTRKPINYTKSKTYELANKLSSIGICIVSGGAMGVDALAHRGAGTNNTISVMANGLDIRYPAVNRELICGIEKDGLVLSQYEEKTKATKWSFVCRNEIVVALGDVLIITQADLNSGSLRSAKFAIKAKKKIFVLPHRIGESMGTDKLIKDGVASAIYDIDNFINSFAKISYTNKEDTFLKYCQTNPTYKDAINKYSQKVFEYELLGKIEILNGCLVVKKI